MFALRSDFLSANKSVLCGIWGWEAVAPCPARARIGCAPVPVRRLPHHKRLRIDTKQKHNIISMDNNSHRNHNHQQQHETQQQQQQQQQQQHRTTHP